MQRLVTFLYYLISITVLLLLPFPVVAQLTIISWNVKNLGKSKSQADLGIMAHALKNCDIIALQEINTAPDGAQKLAELVTLLNKVSSTKWYYNISNPTTSDIANEKERYAYIWKKNKDLKSEKAYLDAEWEKSIIREPFIKQFSYKKKAFVLINYHAVPKKKNPTQEIAYFKHYPERRNLPFLILGDFNCTSSDDVWNPLIKQNYALALINEKTTLRQSCIKNDCLANGLDNFIYPKKEIKVLNAGTIPFHNQFLTDMIKARKISDHLPILITIML